MLAYNYTVQDVDGRILKSHCIADSEVSLHSRLKAMGYSVNSIVKKPASQFSTQHKRVNSLDIVNMCRQFSSMHAAGLSLMDCLSILAKQSESQKLSDILQDIYDRIAAGSSVANAFSKYPNVFSSFFVNMLRAGETTSRFDYILAKLAVYVEKQHDLRRKIREAMAYPVLVLAMILIVVTAMMKFVVPAFSEVYLKLGIELPEATTTLIYISDNVGYILPVMIVLIGACWLSYRKVRTVPVVKSWFDRQILSIPLVGPIYHKIVLLRFLNTLSVTVSAGLPLSEAIDVSKGVAANEVATDAANMIEYSIKRGGTISEAVKMHAFFPQSIGHAFAAGEQAGNLDEMLSKFCDGIEQDVSAGIKKLVLTIEPLIMVVLSAIVGYILLAIYLPIVDLMKLLHK